MTTIDVNTAARAVAARAIVPAPLFKVPLAESVAKGTLKMSTSTGTVAVPRKGRVYGVPLLVEKILRDHPEGMVSSTITELLQPAVAGSWNRQNTSCVLSNMRENKWVTKWPGNVWKLGPRPVAYVKARGIPHNALNGGAGKFIGKPGVSKVSLSDARAPKGEKLAKLAPLPGDNPLSIAVAAVEQAARALDLVGRALADLDTSMVKSKQRDAAIEAALKLLGQAG